MSTQEAARLQAFVDYAQTLSGDEKGEAQVFCDRLFQAFGHAGYKEAGATLEHRIKQEKKSTRFADLVWKPRLLLEMKKGGESLERHYRQAFEYWQRLVPHRPRYVVLCNFREFWVYDFDLQLDQPIDTVDLHELPKRYQALNFLFPDERKPLFNNDRVAVTRGAADKVATIFNSIVARGEDRTVAQRFVLQCVVAMFSEDAGLLPRGIFTQHVDECLQGASTYDSLGALFRQMNSPDAARGGRYKEVRYFNGGLFRVIEPVELSREELELLGEAAQEDWSRVQPPIFGSLFESSMGAAQRHAYGAHFTSEADIQKVVLPTIIRPWRERIDAAKTLTALLDIRTALTKFRVLDPACGSGNFLSVAYRELKRLELDVLLKAHQAYGKQADRRMGSSSLISTRQFFGIDNNLFAVELAKVTLMLAKELALEETQTALGKAQMELGLQFDSALPLDNLDDNIRCDDALIGVWPAADAIIGNPPYQSKNKMQVEYGRAYLNTIRKRYPDVPGRADYCVYWFRRAHDHLPPNGRAGLVGTNTIRQNYSREGGLDYIVETGGTITEAVSTQVWSGDAVVHVSIVNWVKGNEVGKKHLFVQKGNSVTSPWEVHELDLIGPSLSPRLDVSTAAKLRVNATAEVCYQGQTHGHKGFLLSPAEATEMLKADSRNAAVIFPFMIGEDLLDLSPPHPSRFVIDFGQRDLVEASTFRLPFERVKTLVLAAREEAAVEESARNKDALADDPDARINHHHANFLKHWWRLSYGRAELMDRLNRLNRYIACSRVTKRPLFAFLDREVHPNDALQVFLFDDDYSFGVLQSSLHTDWFAERCSTMKADPRYTSDSVFNTYPWPQAPTLAQVRTVAKAARELRVCRQRLMDKGNLSLGELYNLVEGPGQSELKDAHTALDKAVFAAYGFRSSADTLSQLLALNMKLTALEKAEAKVVGPGVPPIASKVSDIRSDDRISA
ncbi:MAG TPA: DNA methyltransferase [Thermoanaerobaculia bacterium]